MERIRKVLTKNKKKIMSCDNVVGYGLGYKIMRGKTTNEPAIIVLVKKKVPKVELKRTQLIPKTFDNVMTDVIEVGEVRLLAQRTDKSRPAQPGMSIGHYKITAGTFGAVVKDEKTGEPLILSNNHVLANATDGYDGRSAIGDPILQPGLYDGGTDDDVIAYLERYMPITRDSYESSCSIAKKIQDISNFFLKFIRPDYRLTFYKERPSHNLIDAALAKPIKPEYISDDIFELGRIQGVSDPKIGMTVKKSGRTSGVTSGKIKAIDVVLKVMLGDSNEATFHEQILTEPIAQPGDSGSIVVDDNMKAVGLLFAGSNQATIINPILNILKLLKVKF